MKFLLSLKWHYPLSICWTNRTNCCSRQFWEVQTNILVFQFAQLCNCNLFFSRDSSSVEGGHTLIKEMFWFVASLKLFKNPRNRQNGRDNGSGLLQNGTLSVSKYASIWIIAELANQASPWKFEPIWELDRLKYKGSIPQTQFYFTRETLNWSLTSMSTVVSSLNWKSLWRIRCKGCLAYLHHWTGRRSSKQIYLFDA